jgi:hypothetical protein
MSRSVTADGLLRQEWPPSVQGFTTIVKRSFYSAIPCQQEVSVVVPMVRSEAGRSEIKSRAQALSRPARNLLLIIDGSKAADEWVKLVNGCTEQDLQQLVDLGLVEPSAVAPRATASGSRGERGADSRPSERGPDTLPTDRPSTQPPVADEEPFARRLEGLDYQLMYATLTREASNYFGALKRYRMVLDVEKCANVHELRVLAMKWNDLILADRGEAQARSFRATFHTGG